MILFHNIEKEGQIWSVRCAVLSEEFVTETVLLGATAVSVLVERSAQWASGS